MVAIKTKYGNRLSLLENNLLLCVSNVEFLNVKQIQRAH